MGDDAGLLAAVGGDMAGFSGVVINEDRERERERCVVKVAYIADCAAGLDRSESNLLQLWWIGRDD